MKGVNETAPPIWMTKWVSDLKKQDLTDVVHLNFREDFDLILLSDHKLAFYGIKNKIVYYKLVKKTGKLVVL